MPPPPSVAWPPADPIRRRRSSGTYLFGGLYAGMVITGFAIGIRAGTPKPTPPARPTLVAAKTTAVAPEPEPKAKAAEATAPEPKPAEPSMLEPKKTPDPPPEPKPEPRTEPKVEAKTTPPAKPGAEVVFAQVAPVFKEKCTICHGGVEPKGGLDLRSAKAALAGGDNGAGLKPGDPENSLIWQSIRDGMMPPPKKPQLMPAEKQLIKDWIAGGAK